MWKLFTSLQHLHKSEATLKFITSFKSREYGQVSLGIQFSSEKDRHFS